MSEFTSFKEQQFLIKEKFNFPGHETLDTVWIFWLFLAWILEIDSHQDFNFPERETLETHKKIRIVLKN
ncbi:hypothetical protein RhiirA4_547225 [Rhizophagus irregularis]|uniref:Uncharacterized protein n=1 Tax=Rhizophagus irregularis TaxID=588596 RepID=A0A2I1H0X7_9GLOM|nr:hypothetical protein RhiirA4_547225 [Rhizophagus irregularis]